MAENLPEKTSVVPSTSPVTQADTRTSSGEQAYRPRPDDGAAGDPRDRVTPEAFFVAPELLGKPLAKPAARGWAWVIDGAIVGALSQAGTFLLAIALAMLSYQLISKRKLEVMGYSVKLRPGSSDGNGQTRAGKLPLIMAALFVGWAAMIGLDWLTAEDDKEAKASEKVTALADEMAADTTGKTPAELELIALRAENRKLKEDGESFSLLDTGRRLLDDIGFGFGWAAVYFSLLTAWWQGQTVGKKMLGLRVLQLNGKPLTVWDCFNRYGGYAAGFATGLLGFAQVFWDANRQAIHDKISFTVVVDEKRG